MGNILKWQCCVQSSALINKDGLINPKSHITLNISIIYSVKVVIWLAKRVSVIAVYIVNKLQDENHVIVK